MNNGEGIRYNTGKIRYDLLPPRAINELAKVLTVGANKYEERNWEKGMSWTSVLASLKRHIAKFELGEDFDDETGLPHIAHAMTNCAFLLEYMSIYPLGDDRTKLYMNYPKIGLDIDDVLADFVPTFSELYQIPTPTAWAFTYDNYFKDLYSNKNKVEHFFLTLPVKTKPEDIPFEPHCYITSRNVDVNITKKWLEINGFPCAPVISIGHGESKVEAAKKAGVEVFVDDSFDNFKALNDAGICCYLFDALHNQRYNVGYKRIKSLNELPYFKKVL